jgi:type II secretory pathway pseudopilin PulG
MCEEYCLDEVARPDVRSGMRSQAGFSLVEAMVVMAISVGVFIIVMQMMVEVMGIAMQTESRNDLASIAQRVVNTVQAEVLQSDTIFENTTVGNAYRANIESQLAGMVAPNSRLPVAQNITTLIPDTSTGPNAGTFVGNCLLIAKQLPPIPVMWNHDNNVGTPDVELAADRFRFEFFYLRRNPARNFRGLGYYLDVNRTDSIQFSSVQQLQPLFAGITVAQRTQIATALRNAGLGVAWNRAFNQPLASSFSDLAANGTLTVDATPAITVARTRSLTAEFGGGRITGKMDYSVNPMAFPNVFHQVPFFAQTIAGQPNYPSGLEFKVYGAGAATRLMSRLVLSSHFQANKTDSYSAFVITAPGGTR